MKKIKLKRFVITVVIMLACYLLQCTLFPSLELASVKPNLLLIVTAAYGFMRGPKTGMWIGFFFGTSDRYSVWNGAGAVCTDLSDDRLCEWPVQ